MQKKTVYRQVQWWVLLLALAWQLPVNAQSCNNSSCCATTTMSMTVTGVVYTGTVANVTFSTAFGTPACSDGTTSINSVYSATYNFGDGSPVSAQTSQPSFTVAHSYSLANLCSVQVFTVSVCFANELNTIRCTKTQTLSLGFANGPLYTINASTLSCKSITLNYSGAQPLNNALWGFGDGSTSAVITNTAQTSITHTYATGGNYLVTLGGQYSENCPATYAITIPDFVVPDFNYTVSSTCTPPASLSLSVVNYTPAFSYTTQINGAAVGFSANAVYTTGLVPGYNFVKLKIANGAGCTTEITKTVVVASPDLYTLTATNIGCKTFSLSYSSPYPLPNAQWAFGDGAVSPIITNTAVTGIVHTYPSSGTYVLSLSGLGISPCTKTITVNVSDFETPDFTYSVVSICSPSAGVLLTLPNYTNGTYSYQWTINGFIFSGMSGLYTSNLQQGNNVIKLTITSQSGCQTSVTKNVTIGAPPANFNLYSSSLCVGAPLSVYGVSPGADSYSWTVVQAGGSTVTPGAGMNPAYNFTAAGSYTVTLGITAMSVCSSSYSQAVTVSAMPDATFSLSPLQCNATVSLSLPTTTYTGYSLSYGNGISYSGTGSVVASQRSGTYTSNGTFPIVLTLVNGACSATYSQAVTVSAPALTLNASGQYLCPGSAVQLNPVLNFLPQNAGALSYSWTGSGAFSSTQQAVSVVTGGTFQVRVTSSGPCSLSLTATRSITALAAPMATLLGTAPVSCSVSTGSASLQLAVNLVKQGYCINGSCTAANPSATNPATVTLSGLLLGQNLITIANGISQSCTGSLPITLVQAVQTQSLTVKQPVNCSGSGAATVAVTPSGGTTSWYTLANFPLNSLATGTTVSGLSAGSYVVRTVNGNCSTQNNFSITSPQINLYKSANSSACAGHSTAVSFTAQFSPTLSASFNYTVARITGSSLTSVGSGSGSTYSLSPGIYSVSASAASCVGSMTFEVGQYDPINLFVQSFKETCKSQAMVSAEAGGGDGNYSYKWYLGGTQVSTGQPLYTLPSLTTAVNLSLSVSDQSGCTATLAAMSFSPYVPVSLLSCGGVGTGSATTISGCDIGACVQGGVAPYNFEWYKLADENVQVEWEFRYAGSTFIATAGQQTVAVAVPAGSGSLNLGLNTDQSIATVSYPYWDFSGGSPRPMMNAAGVAAAPSGSSTSSDHYFTVVESVSMAAVPGLVAACNGNSGATTGTAPFSTGNYSLTVTDANGCAYSFSIGSLVFSTSPTFTLNFEYVWAWGSVEAPTATVDVVLQQNMIEAASDLLNDADECMNNKGKALKGYLDASCSDASAVADKFSVEKQDQLHHHTLYYYDRAGRLTKTVPPQGVAYLTPSQVLGIVSSRTLVSGSTSLTVPGHSLVSTYDYNSFGQLLTQRTPDGGITNFIYDSKNRLRFSQNDRQKAATPAAYSYTRYDELGRIVEVGESTYTTGLSFASPTSTVNLLAADNPAFPALNRRQVTTTVYSQLSPATYYGQPQRFTQNRVSYTCIDEDPAVTGDEHCTYYSYDAHGNVEWLVQDDVPGMGKNCVAYEYDLVSGKVLKVRYNEMRSDRFFHRYTYDAENRLVNVQTSVDGQLWEQDAGYTYYPHGPLKRALIGEDHVQGLDYIYTLQGWLKAINSPSLTSAEDPGQDNLTSYTPPSGKYQDRVAADRHGMALNYYPGDYTRSIAGYSLGTRYAAASFSTGAAPALYNGNISAWMQSQLNTSTTDPVGPRADLYQYDILNRIRASTSLKSSTVAAGWDNINSGNDHTYNTLYRYDGNGNLLSLSRYENNGSRMDSIQYTYDNGAMGAALGSNRLSKAEDVNSGFLNGRGDLEGAHTYSYDATGNMIREIGKERVNISGSGLALCNATTSIEWTVYGKIRKVDKVLVDPASPSFIHKESISFAYDAAGNRVRKEYWKDALATHDGTVQPQELVTTYYVRDAQGNPMATYQRFFDAADNLYKYQLTEQSIYGSDRLGLSVRRLTLASSPSFTGLTLPSNGVTAISEYQNWITTTNKSQLLPNGLVTDNLCQCRVMSIQNGTANPNYSLVQNAVEFLGIANNGVAIAEDLQGNLQFYVVLAKKYLGMNNACLVFDKNGRLMKGTQDIGPMNESSKPVVVNLKGSSTYVVVTLNSSAQPVYHLVDMSLAGYGPLGNTGEVVAANLPLANYTQSPAPQHGYHFTGLEDHINGHSIVYSSRYTADPLNSSKGTTEIVSYDFGTSTLTPQPKLVYSVYGCGSTETGELQIGPGGDKLAWFQHDRSLGGFNIREGSLHLLPLDNARTGMAAATATVQAQSAAGNSGNGMLEFMKNGSSLLYAQRGVYSEGPGATKYDRNVWQYDPVNLSTLALNPNAGSPAISYLLGEVKRGRDGNYYIPNMGRKMDKVHSYSGGAWNGNLTVPDTAFVLAASLPTQVYKIFADAQALPGSFVRSIGSRQYELKDHLGNVKTVISDAKIITDQDANNVVSSADLFAPEVINYQDYYAFGAPMPGLKYQAAGDYRYGFNGKENDSETGTQDYGMRIYDTRIGKFLSVDPITDEYPELTPYQFASNRPIDGIDLDGLENRTYLFSIVMKNGKSQIVNSTVIDYNDITLKGHGADGSGYDKVILAYGNGDFVEYYMIGNYQTFDKDERNKITQAAENLSNAITSILQSNQQQSFDESIQSDASIDETINYPINSGNPTVKIDPITPKVGSANSKVDPNGNKKVIDYSKNRPSFRKGVVDETWEEAKDANGVVKDPNTGKVLTWDKSKSRSKQWHMGHIYGKEYRKLVEDYKSGKLTKKQFLDEYNNIKNYKPEDPVNNMSHKSEQKD